MPIVFALGTAAMVLIGLGAVVVLFLVFAVGVFNNLVTLRNRYKNAFSQIDVQLKRRYDLIPNLVETAKGYMKHERETLEAVIDARNAAVLREPARREQPGRPGVDGQPERAPRASSPGPSAGSWPWPRRTPTSRPTRT